MQLDFYLTSPIDKVWIDQKLLLPKMIKYGLPNTVLLGYKTTSIETHFQ